MVKNREQKVKRTGKMSEESHELKRFFKAKRIDTIITDD